MKSIFKYTILWLVLLLHGMSLQAQEEPTDCKLTDPLFGFVPDTDFCCEGDSTNSVCYELADLIALWGPLNNNSPYGFSGLIYDVPNQGGETQVISSFEHLADIMESVCLDEGGYVIDFIWNETEQTICAFDTDANLGELFLRKSDWAPAKITPVFSGGGNDGCAITEPNIDAILDPPAADHIQDMDFTVSAGLDANGNPILDANGYPAQSTLSTQDVMTGGGSSDPNYTGPSMESVGILLNAALSSGALQNGTGCFNINCVDLTELSGTLAAQVETMADSGDYPDLPDEYYDNQDDFEGMIFDELSAIQNGDGGLAGYFNNSLGLNLPTTPCPEGEMITINEAIEGLTGGTGGNDAKGKNNKSANPPFSPNTAADADFFSDQIAGLGLPGPGAAAPSPSALEMIKNVNGGVNLYNGSQSTSIPLYNLQANDISVPIGLSSSNNGLKVNDMGSIVGQNWSLDAGGMITRMVKGLPDEFDGVTEGIGVGKKMILKPRMEMPSDFGVRIDFSGAEATCFGGDINEKVVNGILLYPETPGVFNIRWKPLRPNLINCVFDVPAFSIFAITFYVELGFNVGITPNPTLGNIKYEETGLGFLKAGNELSSLSIKDAYESSVTNAAKTVQKANAGRWIDDFTFFNDQAVVWADWIEAIKNLLDIDHSYKTTRVDTEPDEFYFNFGNYSGKFSFNIDGTPVIFPNHDGLEIIMEESEEHISSFTIRTPEGMEYVFGSNTLEGVDMTENTNYYLPNFYTYPETSNDREHFGKAQIDKAQMPFLPFLGHKHLITYGNTYERNYKIMKAPKFSSAWHLMSIRSLLTQERVTFGYEKKPELSYYADKSYSHSFPNFGLHANGDLKTDKNIDLNPFHPIGTKWVNGRAEFAYSVTETKLNRYDLVSVNADQRDEKAIFTYIEDRGEIVGDNLLSRIGIHRGGKFYKGWGLHYKIQQEETASSGCNPTSSTEPAASPINIEGETNFNLGEPYSLKWFEHHYYLFISGRIGCLTFPFRIPIGFVPKVLGLVHDFGHRTHLSEYGSLMEVKALNGGYNEDKEAAIFNAESKRSYLIKVDELGRSESEEPGETFDFITKIKYNNDGADIAKRFSIHQDLFGYYRDNSQSGSPLPAITYSDYENNEITSQSNGVNKHFGFFNQDVGGAGAIHLGQKIIPDGALGKYGALQELTFASGGQIFYNYSVNQLPGGSSGAGFRVRSMTENPGDSPAKTTYYKYEEPSVINNPIRLFQTFGNKYYKSYEEKVVTTSSFQNHLFPNKNNHVGYGTVTERWDHPNNSNDGGIGEIVHYFSTPDNFEAKLKIGGNADVCNSSYQKTNRKTNCDFYLTFSPICRFKEKELGEFPPSLEYTPDLAYMTWLMGLEYKTQVFNAAEGLEQSITNSFEETSPVSNTNNGDALKYFKSQMYQFNYPGTFEETYFFRLLETFIPFTVSFTDDSFFGQLVGQLVSLMLNDLIPHPYKYIERNYFVSDRNIKTGNVRLSHTTTDNYYDGENTPNTLSVTTYSYGGSPHSNIPKKISSTQIGATTTATTTTNYFINEQSTIINHFHPQAKSYLQSINYLAPVGSSTDIGEMVSLNVTALKMHPSIPEKVVPYSNLTARNGEIALKGNFDNYNADGMPMKYFLAKSNAQQSSAPDLFFSPITLGWNSQLQLTNRAYEGLGTSYGYNCYHELESTVDPNGVESTYKYDARGRLDIATGFNAHQTTKYAYSIGAGANLVKSNLSFTDDTPAQKMQQTYDGFGKPLSSVRLNDGALLSSTDYDQFWRTTATTNLQSGTTSMTYEDSPIPHWTEMVDAVDNLTRSETIASDEAFELAKVTDPNGHTSLAHSDGLGRTLLTVSPEGSKTRYSFDELGRIKNICNPITENYNYYYNNIGQLYKKEVPGTLDDNGNQLASYIWWDTAFRPIATQDPKGDYQTFEHDVYNRVVKVYAPDGTPNVGNPAEVMNEGTITYNGKVLMNSSYEGTWLMGTEEAVMSGINPNNPIMEGAKSTTYSRDGIGRVTSMSITTPGGATNQTTVKVNDAFLTTESIGSTAGLNHNYIFDFDDVLRPTNTFLEIGDDPSRKISTLVYNGMDLVSAKLLGESEPDKFLQQIDYEYDAAGKLTHINSPETMECYRADGICEMEGTLSYIPDGQQEPAACQLITAININGQTYTVDPVIDLSENTVPIAAAVEAALDEFGMIGTVTQVDNDGPVAVGFTITVAQTNASSIQFVMDNCDTVFDLVIGECCTVDLPDPDGGTLGNPSSDNDDLFFEKITYNKLDIIQIDLSSDCTVGKMRNLYEYDGNHRVMNQTNIIFNPIRIEGRYNADFGYDAAGNITGIGRNGFYLDMVNGEEQVAYGGIDALTYTYQTGTSILEKVIDGTTGNEYAQPYGFVPEESTYDYDFNGNIIEDTGKDLKIEYNLINLPQKVVGEEGNLFLDHSYGGTKVKKVSPDGTTRFYVNGAEIAPNNGGLQIESYDFGDGRVTFRNGKPQFQYKITDHLGNTMVLFQDKDSDGKISTELTADAPEAAEVLQRNHYYPFGMPMQGEWKDMTSPKMDYLYNGKENDEELGLNWMNFGFRYYDNAIGRFTGVDPIAEQFAHVSSYNYAENDPIRQIDLWGLQGITAPLPGALLRSLPRLSIPKGKAIPMPYSIPLPPTILYPFPISDNIDYMNDIDWANNPPASPTDLGGDWENITHPDNKSGSQDFKNKKTGEEIRFDPGKDGKPGFEGKDHWHRRNPDWEKSYGKRDYYLDKDGKPVNKGSSPSHIVPGGAPLPPAEVTPNSRKQWRQYERDKRKYEKAQKKYWKQMEKAGLVV